MGKGKSGKPVQAQWLEPEFNLHPRSVVFSLPKLLAYLSVGLLSCSDSQTKVECLGWLQKDESPDDTPDCIARQGHVPFETFLFCLNRYTIKRKQSPLEEKRDTISPHQWEEKWKGGKKNFSSSALNHCRLWNSRGAGGGGVELCWQLGEKRPIRGSPDSDVFKMFDVSLAAMTHFCTVVESSSDQKPQNKCYCFPLLPCGLGGEGVGAGVGFQSPDFLQEEMCTHPARLAIKHPGAAGSPRRQDPAPRITQHFHFPEVKEGDVLNGSNASAFPHRVTPWQETSTVSEAA